MIFPKIYDIIIYINKYYNILDSCGSSDGNLLGCNEIITAIKKISKDDDSFPFLCKIRGRVRSTSNRR